MSSKSKRAYSNTNVNNCDLGFFDKSVSISRVLGEGREVCSLRVNKKLWLEALEKAKGEGLSLCHIIEPTLLAYVEGRNIPRVPPILIEHFEVTRVLTRPRRNPQDLDFPFCEVVWCGRYGVYTLEDKEGKLHYFCKSHSRSPQLTHGWRLVEK